MKFMDLFIALIALAAVGWAVVRWRRDLPKVKEPSCGKCYYAVRQLPTSICPECGSDLDFAGILYPERRSIAGLAVEVISVAVLLFAGMIIIGNAVPLPRLVQWRQEVYLTPTDKSAGYRFNVQAVQREWRIVRPIGDLPPAPANPSLIVVEYKPLTGSSSHVEADVDQNHFTIVNGNGRRRTVQAAFDSAGALWWLNTLGVTGSDAAQQGDVLAKAVSFRADWDAVYKYLGPLFIAQGNKVALMSSGGSSGTGILSDRWMLRAGIVIIVVLWLVYARRAIRRGRPCRPCAV